MAARKSRKPFVRKEEISRQGEGRRPNQATITRRMALNYASPSFTVNDLEKASRGYRDVPRFAPKRTGRTAERSSAWSLRAGDVSFMIAQDDWKKGRKRKKGEGFRISA